MSASHFEERNFLAFESHYLSTLLNHYGSVSPYFFDKFSDLIHAVWFPDNIPRRDRALQLQNDISVLQQSAVEARDSMNTMDSRMVPYVNKILAGHNMSTFDDLKKKLDESLTDEQKEQYKQVKLAPSPQSSYLSLLMFSSGL